MPLIKATEAITVEHPVFCIFGEPGIGKSSLGYSAKDPLLLDFDNGSHRAVNRRDTWAIYSWADVTEVMSSDALKSSASVIVDTVGRCLDLMTVDIIHQNPKMGRDGNLSIQGFGVLKTRFRTWLAQLRAMGKDVVLIGHNKEEKDGDLRIVRPEITGGSYGEVMKSADFVGYIYMNGKERVLDFNPTDRWVGKNPGGWPPLVIPPAAKATSFLGDRIEMGRQALGKISEVSSEITRFVDDWRAKIDAFKTPEEFNEAIPHIKNLGPMLYPQIAKLLTEYGAKCGFPFDKTAKQFTDAPATVGTL